MNETPTATPVALEEQRFVLERARYRADIAKWLVAAIGAMASFGIIDCGKLALERERSAAENQRELLRAYLAATESAQPDIWRRKLRIIHSLAAEDRIREWARNELRDLDEFAAKQVLYRETLRVASQLVTAPEPDDSERAAARKRFEQLYWADLPYVGEEPTVAVAMVKFRNALVRAEASPQDSSARGALEVNLLQLADTLRSSTPQTPE